MIVREADAAVLPSYRTYEVGEMVFRPLVNQLGGYTVHNAEALRPLDGKAYSLAPNHRSNWDSFVLGLAMLDLPELTKDSEAGPPLEPRAVHYMAKDSLWRYPVVKQFVERCGAFPVERGRGIGLETDQVNHITNLAEHDAAMVIYPQGHRERSSEDEESLEPAKFKTTIAYLHLKYGIPIVPVGIYGPVGRGPKFPRSLKFGEPIFSETVDPEDPGFKSAKAAVMSQLHERTNQTYQEVRQLHKQEYSDVAWADLANNLANTSVAGTALAGLTAGLTWKLAERFRRS